MAGSYGSLDRHMQREQQRQLARQQRLQEAARHKEPKIPCLFGPPQKITNVDDKLSQQMKNIFGEYQEVRPLLSHQSVVGASRQPITPQTPGPVGRAGPFASVDQSGGATDSQHATNGAYSKIKPEVSERKSLFDQFSKPQSTEPEKPAPAQSHENREHSRSKSHGASRKSRLSTDKYKVKEEVRDATISGDSKHRHEHSREHKHHGSSSRERHHSHDSHKTSSKSTEKSSHPREGHTSSNAHSPSQGDHTKTFRKPNGVVNGNLKSKHKEPHHEKTLKLHIPNETNQPSVPANMCVEQIMQEMTFEPALTGIITPKKEDGLGFPFPDSKDSATRQLFSKSSNSSVLSKQKNMCTKEQNRMLHQDLDVSSDSESEAQVVQPRHRKESLSKVKRSPKHSTSHSESSSDESSSDSDSSDNEDEKEGESLPAEASADVPKPEKEEGELEEEASEVDGAGKTAEPVKSWALMNWRATDAESSLDTDLLNSQPSQQEPVDAMDKSNEDLCNEIIFNDQSLNLPDSLSLEDLMNGVDNENDGDLPGLTGGPSSVNTLTPERTNKLQFSLAHTPPDLLSPTSPILSPRQPRSVPAVMESVLKTEVASPGASSTRSLGSSSHREGKSPGKRSRKRSDRSTGSDSRKDHTKEVKDDIPVKVEDAGPPKRTPSKEVATPSKPVKPEPSSPTVPTKPASGSRGRPKGSSKSSSKPSPATTPKKGRSQARSPKSRPILFSSSSDSYTQSSDNSSLESEAEDAETSFVDVVGLSSPAKVASSPSKLLLKISSPKKTALVSSPAKNNGDLTPRRKPGRPTKASLAVADVLEEVAETRVAPLLSPIRSEEPSLKSPCPPLVPAPPTGSSSGLAYVDGLPSIVVKLDVRLLDLSHLNNESSADIPPASPVDKDQVDGKKVPSDEPAVVPGAKEAEVLSQIFKDRQPVQTKIPKRKHSESRSKDEGKRARLESSSSQRSPASQPEQKEKTSHTDDHKWDRKHPQRSQETFDDPPSSQSDVRPSPHSRDHSSPAQWDRSSDRSSRDRDRYRHKDRSNKDWDAPSSESPPGQSPVANGNHPAAAHWSAMMTGAGSSRRHSPRPPPPPPQFVAPDTYLEQARRLKHQADALNERLHKSVTYVEAVLSFLQCGNAMEQDNVSEAKNIYTMFQDTLTLIRHICKFRGNQDSEAANEKEKKLAVLSARIQSLLYLKLFKLKRTEASKLKRVLDDFNNKGTQSKPLAQAPSPYQTNWNTRSTGTPSPMSPQPSPGGSVGSVGSVGSGNGDHRVPNGNAAPPASLAVNASTSCVSVPQRIQSVTQQYLTHMNNLYQAHDMWEQADSQAAVYREFFGDLDHELGQLSLHSSMWDLVRYVQAGLQRLKDT